MKLTRSYPLYCSIGACLLLATAARAQTSSQPSTSTSAQSSQGQSSTSSNAIATNASPQTTAQQQSAQVEQLTPFEVNASKDHGYFTANTLAGTRLNNNVGDIPSSITIVSNQELIDTSSWNINDVFNYQAGTEGASTYTPITLVRGSVADVLANSLATSGNRVRGLAAADLEMDNFYSISRIPFDSYNTQSLEIDRGPNSILFGSGSPAGIVNQERIQPNLDHLSGSASVTVGSWGTVRDTTGLNIPLIPDQVGIYLGQEYTSLGFKQKPSSDYTRREYAAFRIDPFKNHKTRISGSFEYWNNFDNDPNTITPVDLVTPWLQSGRPVYNPLTDKVTYLSTGVTTAAYALSSTYPNYAGVLQTALTTSTSPYFVPSLTYASTGHNFMFVDSDNVVENFYHGEQAGLTAGASDSLPTGTAMTPAQMLIYEEKVTTSTNLPAPAAYQVWQLPTLSNKAIYDWSAMNLNTMAESVSNARVYHLDVQQEIVDGLNFDFGWFRQELQQLNDQPLSQANATTIYVDTNQFLLDGRPNPHEGQPYLDVYAADLFQQPEKNNNYRGSLEYEFNVANHVPGWLKWLGHHRLMGVFMQHDDIQQNLRYRESIDGGDVNYLPTAAALASATGYGYPLSNTAIDQWYYLAGPSGGAPNGSATAAPGTLLRPGNGGPTSATIESYNYNTNQWVNSTINMNSILYPTGGFSENLQDQKTYFWQSFFWDDRIVGIVGIDDDQVKNRQTVFPATTPTAIEYTAGFPNPTVWNTETPWQYVGGNTANTGFVLHPFTHWSFIDSAANNGNLLAAFARTVSFTFNKSDNFNPPPAFYTDFYGNSLGKPTGKEKDYGFTIATPDNKLFLRATWYNTQNLNQLVSDTSNSRALYIDATELHNWATTVVEIRNGENPTDPNFGNVSVYPISTTEQTQIAALTGLPYNYGGNVGPSGQFVNPYETENGVAHGTELELTYNPVRQWRMKLSWTYSKTVLSDIAGQAAALINNRLPIWPTYVASDLNQVYTKSTGAPMYVGSFWQGYGYDSNVTGPGNINGWTTTQNYYNIVVAGQLATDRALNGTQATNQRDYIWSYLTTYDFDRGILKNFTLGGAVRYLGESVAGYYGDTQNLSPSGQIFQPNVGLPIYNPDEWHYDAWIAYHFRLPWQDGRIRGTVQLNGKDLNISSRLQAVTYNYDGSPATYRIIQPKSFELTTRFDY